MCVHSEVYLLFVSVLLIFALLCFVACYLYSAVMMSAHSRHGAAHRPAAPLRLRLPALCLHQVTHHTDILLAMALLGL